MIGVVKVTTVRYFEDEVFEGSIPRERYDNATTEIFEVDDIEEAVQVFTSRGLTFAATGNDWAANPDGSYISDYRLGERVEETARLEGFTDEQIRTIVAAVG